MGDPILLSDILTKEIKAAQKNHGQRGKYSSDCIRNLSNISENLSAARSQIRDTDFAAETAELTRNQIIQQASVSVLSQANQRPQTALSLLG